MVIPSRLRPGSITRLRDAMEATCTGETDLVVGCDSDDPQLQEYLDALVLDPSYRIEVKSDLHQVVGWINELALPEVDNYRYIGHFGDDNVPRTPGWDTAIMEALEKDTPFAFGNDLYPRAPGSLCCHVFTRSEVIKALGYFGPPGIKHMYVDVAWMAWGVATGISYLDDVILEHLHYTTGKSNYDSSYLASTGLIPEDLQNWHAYSRSPQLNDDILKINAAVSGAGLRGLHCDLFTDQSLAQLNVNLNIPESLGHYIR